MQSSAEPVADREVDDAAAVGGIRTCRACGAIYRKQFARCPSDGGEIVVVDGDPLIGRTLGSYVLDALIGEGAMGRVYRAHHARLAAKRFALKVLHGDHASDQTMRMRFAKEAAAVSRLAHPNVVGVADFGKSAEGLFFIAMELVDGISLADLLEGGPLPPARVVHLARGLCAGLTHAHAHHLIHRDLKPDNVLVVLGAAGEVPRIVDFGIALATDREDARLTSTGFTMGTPAYVAPEQAVIGKAVDHRADLYALGVMMFEMLTGALPFAGEPMEVVLAKATREAPPVVGAPPALARIVAQLLARDPDARFASAAAVDAALARASLAASPAVGAARTAASGATRRWPMAAFAAAVLAAAVVAWSVGRDRASAAAEALRPSWLLLAGEVLGVLDERGQVVPTITRRNFAAVAAALGGSRGTDVTGGMAAKVESMLRLVDAHPHLAIRIFTGLEAGLVGQVLGNGGETAVGTLLTHDAD